MNLYHMDLKVAMYQKTHIQQLLIKLKQRGFAGVVVEIDNKLIFPSHPDFAAADALTSDEWRDIVRFGKQQGLVIYPLLQTLGHMEHVLANVRYSNLAENLDHNYMLCPSKAGTTALIQDLIRDVADAFDRPLRIHLGGDEVYGHMPGKGIHPCPLCKGKDAGELMMNYLVTLADFCLEQGILPEFWADEILTWPDQIDRFPRQTRFVDWLYRRTETASDTIGHIWGAKHLMGEPMHNRMRDAVPEPIQCLVPYLFKGDRFNPFYGAEYIAAKGYPVMIASAVRSAGDCYAVPRCDLSSQNVAASAVAAARLDCDHLVTSWAVRLSHPDTTWFALEAIRGVSPFADQLKGTARGDQLAEKKQATSGTHETALGRFTAEQLQLLTDVAQGIRGIDILTEQKVRYERPFMDQHQQVIYELWRSPARDETVQLLKRRIAAGETLLPLLGQSLAQGVGDQDCIRHWQIGVELCLLRARQTLAVMQTYTAGIDRALLADLLRQNKALLQRFEQLWSESVSRQALQLETEVKFRRDIRLLENLLCP